MLSFFLIKIKIELLEGKEVHGVGGRWSRCVRELSLRFLCWIMPVVVHPRKGNVGMLFENLKLNNENQLKILHDCDCR